MIPSSPSSPVGSCRFFPARGLWLALPLFTLLIAACDTVDDGGSTSLHQFDYLTPVLVSPSLTFTSLGAGVFHSCGTTADGTAYCWGANQRGELGTSSSMDTCGMPPAENFPCSGTPLPVSGSQRFTTVQTGQPGNGYSCGLNEEGKAYCWGFGLGGQLGDGLRRNSSIPVAVSGGREFEVLSVGFGGLACGIAVDGHTYCWGVNSSGQLGTGVASSAEAVPRRITDELRFTSIDLGDQHACGLTADGTAYCWGSNWYGTLGIGPGEGPGGIAQSLVPVRVQGDLRFTSIVTGSNQTCALEVGGAAYCWGAPMSIGSTPSPAHHGTARAVAGGHTFVSLHAGYLHTCGLTAAGDAYCWGENLAGEIGDGSRVDRQLPTRIQTDIRFASLSHRPTCGLSADGRAHCWGANSFGSVGRTGYYVGRPLP
ncbi:hypothetical protein BH23BAC4_BH23BAC4_15130 [soil metagenome]